MAKTNCDCVCHKLGYIYCGPGYCPDHEPVQPERTTCPDCGGDGSQGNDCTCPGWVAVPENHADAKALLAKGGMSLGLKPEQG
jgi:uncharacterized protein CbrC (UPF0167 family)